jgi:hypothetical protein
MPIPFTSRNAISFSRAHSPPLSRRKLYRVKGDIQVLHIQPVHEYSEASLRYINEKHDSTAWDVISKYVMLPVGSHDNIKNAGPNREITEPKFGPFGGLMHAILPTSQQPVLSFFTSSVKSHWTQSCISAILAWLL